MTETDRKETLAYFRTIDSASQLDTPRLIRIQTRNSHRHYTHRSTFSPGERERLRRILSRRGDNARGKAFDGWCLFKDGGVTIRGAVNRPLTSAA